MISMFKEIIPENEIKFNSLEKKIFKFVCNLDCMILKMLLESYDRKLMKARDTKRYRHKGLRKNTIKTIMGEVEYRRVMYEMEENGIHKTVYLLDEKMHINADGKVSENLIEKVVELVPITDSYRKAERENKEFNPKMKIKTELKLHVMYEGWKKDGKRMEKGWKKDDRRHSLVNKQYIAGIMKPKEIAKLRDARVFRQYDVEKIKIRVTNGDGAKWTKGTTSKGGFYQKDEFHIMQEIVRDVPKEYREIIKELVIKKEYEKIPSAIEKLKYEIGGEYKAVKKLNKFYERNNEIKISYRNEM